MVLGAALTRPLLRGFATPRSSIPVALDVGSTSGCLLAALPDLHASGALLPSNLLAALPDFQQTLSQLLPADIGPVQSWGVELSQLLDRDKALEKVLTGEETTMVLDSIGHDLLIFLTASVIVTPVSRALNVSPILAYLCIGALLGPYGVGSFSNAEADVELGDFGILFLLFSEGLEVSSDRLRTLANYLPLGLAQISLTSGVLTFAILLGLPEFLDRFLPLDTNMIDVTNPSEALILAVAGTLSTSAFVFPALKEKGWEESDAGQAATSILLLQDLAVAPLLVLLPFIVGQGITDPTAVAFLTAKATLGFGSVVFAGSLLLRSVFDLVAKTRSAETFVALCLLVAVGMGAIATSLGLTDTAGAFAAGVLLANTNYRAQIQADILPFKGILLGIFFMEAGSSFDTSLLMTEAPTILTGALSLVLLKASTLFLATRVPEWLEPKRLRPPEGVRLATLLAGGGEFAFVVLAAAEKLGALPADLGGLLTAIVLVTMALTPLLSTVAEKLSAQLIDEESQQEESALTAELQGLMPGGTQVASDSVVVVGFGEVGRSVSKALDGRVSDEAARQLPRIVAFDTDPSLVRAQACTLEGKETVVCFGDGANPTLLRMEGVDEPRAFYVTYDAHSQCLAATERLRASFPSTPVYGRARTRSQAQELLSAGATQVVVETDELPRNAPELLLGSPAPQPLDTFEMPTPATNRDDGAATLRGVVTKALNVEPAEAARLVELHFSVDKDASGTVELAELRSALRRGNGGVVSDTQLADVERWLDKVYATEEEHEPLGFLEFCRVYLAAEQIMNRSASGVGAAAERD